MGNACSRRKADDGFNLIPTEYQWDGINTEMIEKYYAAKEEAMGDDVDNEVDDGSWLKKLPRQEHEKLKALLMERAICLVKVLMPIEKGRSSNRKMQEKGFFPPGYFESFEAADAACQEELQSIGEESQLLVPEAPPMAIVHQAVRIHLERDPQTTVDEDGNEIFADVKKGFLKSERKQAHGFPVGSWVEAHSLKTAELNGKKGKVLGARADRVAVKFPEPIGEKALKKENLKPVDSDDMPGSAEEMEMSISVHEDAKELPPVLTPPVQIKLDRAKGEGLGLSLNPTPEFLLVKGVIEEGEQVGYGKKHNEIAESPEQRLMPMDHIVAVVDLGAAQPSPVGGDSGKMLDVIKSGCTPLGLLVRHFAGPPVRFAVGQNVLANCDGGRMPGKIVHQWPRNQQTGQIEATYVIRLEAGNIVTAPRDDDSFVCRGEPRFKEEDTVMAHVQGGYKKAIVKKVIDKKITHAFALEVQPTGGETEVAEVTAPQDLDQFIRPVARFKDGDRVKCNVGNDKYEPGKIAKTYHPAWVYAVDLDIGRTVNVPEDHDGFCKKFDD